MVLHFKNIKLDKQSIILVEPYTIIDKDHN